MAKDIVTRPCCDVRPCGCADARMVIDHLHAEIERLRRMAQTMAGFISTTTEWLNSQPEDVYHAFYDKAVLDAPNS